MNMKVAVVAAVMLCPGLGLIPMVQAEDAVPSNEEILENQLQDYPNAYQDFLKDKTKLNQKIEQKAKKVKEESKKVMDEYQNLQTGYNNLVGQNLQQAENIKKLEDSSAQLTLQYKKAKEDYDKVQAQYNEQLAAQKQIQQQVENEKTIFNKKLLDFYQEEAVRLNEKIEEYQKKQEEVQMELKKYKEPSADEASSPSAALDAPAPEMGSSPAGAGSSDNANTEQGM